MKQLNDEGQNVRKGQGQRIRKLGQFLYETKHKWKKLSKGNEPNVWEGVEISANSEENSLYTVSIL